ncbi:MAG: STAS domain-containing protein [Phycisphaerales bacterium]|jgi:anti-sigma B factor antagonist|nr:STAS domain-containing protein [Phycisphaerales bacterium]
MVDLKTASDLVSSARQEGQTVVVAIRGDIDLHNSTELRTELLDILIKTSARKLVLNLEQVPYIDSSAVAVLVELLQRLRKSGGKIVLTNLQPRVRGLLEIARLDTIFVLVANEAEAQGK